jgi:protoporphyrinogen oxidase
VLRNVVLERDEISWGPNNTFRFPERGGTGAIWKALASRLPAEKASHGKRLVAVDTRRRRARFSDGSDHDYDLLVSTMPLDQFVEITDRDDLRAAAKSLRHSSTHVIGLGLRGTPPSALATKCWMYFPEDTSPFYRVTVFSNYSHNNVPDIRTHWSLMAEVSESPRKPVNEDRLIEDVLRGAEATRLIESRDQVVDIYHRRLEHGYPTPSLGRDGALAEILPALDAAGVHSRGRFGAWKYEVSNQDHGLMQGVEIAERILLGAEEETLWKPDFVNRGGARMRSVESDPVEA